LLHTLRVTTKPHLPYATFVIWRTHYLLQQLRHYLHDDGDHAAHLPDRYLRNSGWQSAAWFQAYLQHFRSAHVKDGLRLYDQHHFTWVPPATGDLDIPHVWNRKSRFVRHGHRRNQPDRINYRKFRGRIAQPPSEMPSSPCRNPLLEWSSGNGFGFAAAAIWRSAG
jgi:hypothetical protein